jgi:hypothetical protein
MLARIIDGAAPALGFDVGPWDANWHWTQRNNAPLGLLQNILGRGTMLKEDKAITFATACDSVTYCFHLVLIERNYLQKIMKE